MTRLAAFTFLLALALLAETGIADADADANARVRTDGCGVAASCFALPPGCLARGGCVAVVSITKQEDADVFTFDMEAARGIYVAVGLSEDRSMGHTSVVECVRTGGGGGVELFASYNLPGVHVNLRIPPLEGVVLLNGSFVDGRVRCVFARRGVSDVVGNLFDMNNNEYHVLLAAGSRVKSSPGGANLAYHDVIRGSSSQARRLGDVGMFTA